MPRLWIPGRRGRRYVAAAAGLLAAAGIVATTIGIRAQQDPPQPPRADRVVSTPTTGAPSGPSSTAATPPPPPSTPKAPAPLLLPRSIPTHLDIPAIAVSSPLQSLGLLADGTVEVPPLGKDSHAGWFRNSPTPGQLGPSIILGHIDSAKYGPGVFFKLAGLHPADTVSVTRADHTVAVFRVDEVKEYPKDHFPTVAVYGSTDHAALRLITCGGTFDTSEHSYTDNIVAYASLVSTHPA